MPSASEIRNKIKGISSGLQIYPLPAFYFSVTIEEDNDAKSGSGGTTTKNQTGPNDAAAAQNPQSQPSQQNQNFLTKQVDKFNKMREKPDPNVTKGSFSEVSGLTYELQTIDYREGTDSSTIPRKIKGMEKYSNVTLKRGVFLGNDKFYLWMKDACHNNIDRKTIAISLRNPEGKALVTWNLQNAYPIKIDGPSMKSDGNEVAVESVEFVHEGFTVTHEKEDKSENA